MVTKEELLTQVQRTNTIIQDGLNATDIIKIPEVNDVTGIIILRFASNRGVYTTCIGAVNFHAGRLAFKDWEEHGKEMTIQTDDKHG